MSFAETIQHSNGHGICFCIISCQAMTGEMKPFPAQGQVCPQLTKPFRLLFLEQLRPIVFLPSSPQPMLEAGHTPHVSLFSIYERHLPELQAA